MNRQHSLAAFLAVSACLLIAACVTRPEETAEFRLAKKHNCLACHSVDKRFVGPAFNAIAEKYRGQDVQDRLLTRLRRGGSGEWGPIPEPPHMAVSNDDLRTLIRWITNLEAPTPTRATEEAPATACTVQLIQEGTVIQGVKMGRATAYDLKGAPFQFEVSSGRCAPSIGVFLSQDHFQFVADSRYVFSDPGFSMAGSTETSDVLVTRAEDPRLTGDYVGLYDSVDETYQQACRLLESCPRKIRAFRSYWNFPHGRGGTPVKSAEFKRLTMNKSIQGNRSAIAVVVYTKVKDFRSQKFPAVVYNVMETHPVILRFQ